MCAMVQSGGANVPVPLATSGRVSGVGRAVIELSNMVTLSGRHDDNASHGRPRQWATRHCNDDERVSGHINVLMNDSFVAIGSRTTFPISLLFSGLQTVYIYTTLFHHRMW